MLKGQVQDVCPSGDTSGDVSWPIQKSLHLCLRHVQLGSTYSHDYSSRKYLSVDILGYSYIILRSPINNYSRELLS